MKIEPRKWRKTLVIPIIVTVSTFIAWILFNNIVYNTFLVSPPPKTIWDLVDTIIFAPISEQIFQGFLFLIFFISLNEYYKNERVVGIFGIIFSSIILTALHPDPNTIDLLPRFLCFMLFGTFYYLNERNLMPAIIAHSTWNLIILNTIHF